MINSQSLYLATNNGTRLVGFGITQAGTLVPIPTRGPAIRGSIIDLTAHPSLPLLYALVSVGNKQEIYAYEVRKNSLIEVAITGTTRSRVPAPSMSTISLTVDPTGRYLYSAAATLATYAIPLNNRGYFAARQAHPFPAYSPEADFIPTVTMAPQGAACAVSAVGHMLESQQGRLDLYTAHRDGALARMRNGSIFLNDGGFGPISFLPGPQASPIVLAPTFPNYAIRRFQIFHRQEVRELPSVALPMTNGTFGRCAMDLAGRAFYLYNSGGGKLESGQLIQLTMMRGNSINPTPSAVLSMDLGRDGRILLEKTQRYLYSVADTQPVRVSVFVIGRGGLLHPLVRPITIAGQYVSGAAIVAEY